jgi:transposase
MSLHPLALEPVPGPTAQVARAAFPKGNLYLTIRDELGTVYRDEEFAALFPVRGQPGLPPWRLAVVTVLQFAENLSDRQAAEAVRARIDWKYLLGLDLTDPGFDFSVLSEFRARLLDGEAERGLLDILLTKLEELGLFKARGRQRTDSTHVLAAVRKLNRLERVGETLRAALNSLAVVAPEWLQAMAPEAWYERYGRRVENYQFPKTETARQDLAQIMGADGQHLLKALEAASDHPWLREVPAVQMLHRVWTEQYLEEAGTLRWRTPEEMPAPAELISSPYDPDARYSTKQSMEWVGYKVHLTETCDLDRPHLIVNVETTPASTPDDPMVAVIHASLAQQNRLPAEHLVDKGYTDAQVLLDSQNEYQVAITGPVAEDPSWQARAGTGFDKAHFQVDWNRRVVTCPAGHQSRSWLKNSYPKNGVVWEAHFSRQDCTPCPFRAQCTHAKVEPRIIGLQTREQHEVLQVARHRQTTEEFRAQYAARAGIESTHEQAIRRCGLRHSRYIGLAKTHLQQVITATAVNLIRLGEWWAGTPLAPTRISRFAQLNPLAQAA